MICFFPNDDIQIKENMCSCENCLRGQFIKCENKAGSQVSSREVNPNAESDEDDDEEFDYDCDGDRNELAEIEKQNQQIRGDCVFELLQKESFIAIFSPPNSRELFYICKVLYFGVADEDLTDNYIHFILKGSSFITCQYLERLSEKKRNIFYFCTSF